VPTLGRPQTPSLEAIVALKPDLILDFSWYHQNIYDQLTQIAPTVITNYEHGRDTQKIITLIGSALGKKAATQQLIANYFARLEEFKSKMGSRLQNYEVSVVRIQENNFGLLQRGSYSGVILEDAGLLRPASQQYVEIHKAGGVWRHIQINISNERIPDLDADALFVVASGDPDSQQRVKTLKANPLWSKLNVVQQGKVYEVSDYWLVGGSIALNLVIDDLFRYLVSPAN
jgi:iron complex transport system substrate-binding protein